MGKILGVYHPDSIPSHYFFKLDQSIEYPVWRKPYDVVNLNLVDDNGFYVATILTITKENKVWEMVSRGIPKIVKDAIEDDMSFDGDHVFVMRG